MTPMNEVGMCFVGGSEWLIGKEYNIGKNGTRLAPWGNRTGHKAGKFPHYHRKIFNRKGKVKQGQGIKRHRPWDKKPTDKSLWDRF